MSQRSQMYYAYFRFYTDESQIEAGLRSFCTGWEPMFAVGYNYKEYKCFVDNLGGFEHFVGDMRGYISPVRESGFIDGAPSDAVYDTSLLMGAERINSDNFLTLNAVKQNALILLRKITAQDAGIAHKIKIISNDAIINHPVMYTLDSNQIEVLKPQSLIIDDSDVDSYEYTADVSTSWLLGGSQYSIQGSVSNFENIVDRDKTTYGQFTANVGNTWRYLVIDMGETFSAISVYAKNILSGNGWKSGIYVSPDAATLTHIGGLSGSEAFFTVGRNDVAGSRYVHVAAAGSGVGGVGKCQVYQILCS